MFGGDLRGAARLADVPAVQEPAPDRFVAFERGAAANLLAFRAMAQWQEEDIRRLLVLADSHNERAQAAFSQGYTLALRCLLQVIRARPGGHRRAALSAGPAAAPGTRMAAAALGAVRIWSQLRGRPARRRGGPGRPVRTGHHARRGAGVRRPLDGGDRAPAPAARTPRARQRHTLDTLERIGFESRWSVVREMVAWERLRMAAAAARAGGQLLRRCPGRRRPTAAGYRSRSC